MPYNPAKHHRQSTRLKGFDYTAPGAYFVTIYVHRRASGLGRVVKAAVALSEWGNAVRECWRTIPDRFPNAALDEWVVMPNHVHGIIVIRDHARPNDHARPAVGAQHAAPLPAAPAAVVVPAMPSQPRGTPRPTPGGVTPNNVAAGSLGAMIRSFKSAVTNQVNALRHTPGAVFWQRGFYDEIIWDDRALDAIRRYIRNNPAQWALDRDNTSNRRRVALARSTADYVREALRSSD